jgi:hypothetical protein
MGKLLIAATLMLVVGNGAIADDQVQSPPPKVQCNDFAKITAEAQKRSALVAAALKSKAEPRRSAR